MRRADGCTIGGALGGESSMAKQIRSVGRALLILLPVALVVVALLPTPPLALAGPNPSSPNGGGKNICQDGDKVGAPAMNLDAPCTQCNPPKPPPNRQSPATPGAGGQSTGSLPTGPPRHDDGALPRHRTAIRRSVEWISLTQLGPICPEALPGRCSARGGSSSCV